MIHKLGLKIGICVLAKLYGKVQNKIGHCSKGLIKEGTYTQGRQFGYVA